MNLFFQSRFRIAAEPPMGKGKNWDETKKEKAIHHGQPISLLTLNLIP